MTGESNFSMASAAAFASGKSHDNGFKSKFEKFIGSNSTKTGESSSGGHKITSKTSPRVQPLGNKKLTYEEPILMPTQTGINIQRQMDQKLSEELFNNKPFISEGRSPRGNIGIEQERREFENLRISIIPPGNQDENLTPDTLNLNSPQPTREIKLT